MTPPASEASRDAGRGTAPSAVRPDYLARLNPAQLQAALHDARSPLLVIAGAGSGKTDTLAHRVAHLILGGADPRRILLLTFTRRAALEMGRRTERIVEAARRASRGDAPSAAANVRWSGTFHGIANRLLRLHAESVGLDPAFTVLDRADAADLLDLERSELGLGREASAGGRGRPARFPRKGTCLAIYSRVVNARGSLVETLERAYPWCACWSDALKQLFAAYVEAKQRQNVLDYDDLLLYWHAMMEHPVLAGQVAERFDHVLVDEYQDTNALQAAILLALKPTGEGLTVVGDDAQSIYGFRAASVRNILDFPSHFTPAARVVTLEQNYRSTQPILAACNAVIDLARERYCKRLHSDRASEQRPVFATVEDEMDQVDYVIERVLAQREAGVALKHQAVLMRAAHHSDPLEVELARRSIPFVKYGGLKFLEAAHVKDVLSILRVAENPRDAVAGFRVLQLLPGIGPGYARQALAHLGSHRHALASLAGFSPPASARCDWLPLCRLLSSLAEAGRGWSGQLAQVREWYAPHLQRLYDTAHVRAGDLEQLEQIGEGYPSRDRFLSELTLDPPDATGDEAGAPLLDEDYLILSTIHSAKGQEWDAVYVLNAADGCIPSDMATGSPDEIEEERRLLYVAMTRARDELHLIHPLRFFKRQQHRQGDANVFTPRTRFVPDPVLARFERRGRARGGGVVLDEPGAKPSGARVDVGLRLREMWR